MKRYIYLLVFSLAVSLIEAREKSWSSSYSSSSSSTQEVINGKVVKSKKTSQSYGDEKAAVDGKIVYENSDFSEDASAEDPFLGIKVSGEDYFNYANEEFDFKEDRKLIKLLSGSCSLSKFGSGLSDTQVTVLKKNGRRNQLGDFAFGIFDSSQKKITENAAECFLEAFYQDAEESAVAAMAEGLANTKEYNDLVQYAGDYSAGLGILKDLGIRKELSIWCPFDCKALVYSRGVMTECDDAVSFKNISKGDVIVLATKSFWSVMENNEVLKFAKKNLSRKKASASAIAVAENLIIMARKKGGNQSMNLLVIYIL